MSLVFSLTHTWTSLDSCFIEYIRSFFIGALDLQVAKTVDLIKAKGGKVSREPGPVKGGNTVIAFIEDPDGYKFELLERGPTPEPLCQIMLRVGDLDRAIEFYEKVWILYAFL